MVLITESNMNTIILTVLSLAAASYAFHDPMMNEGLFQGDIMGIDPDVARNAVPLASQRWPGGVIPYVVSPALESTKKIIRDVINHLETVTCLRFIERTYQHEYIHFSQETGCWSYVGKIGREQKLSIGRGCEDFGVILHELLHAIGFYHEHTRSDRDNYITIHWDNIPQKYYNIFYKLRPEQNRLLTEFDFYSIMMYHSYGFAIDPKRVTMSTKDGKPLPGPQHKTKMTNSDIKRVNILYECDAGVKSL